MDITYHRKIRCARSVVMVVRNAKIMDWEDSNAWSANQHSTSEMQIRNVQHALMDVVIVLMMEQVAKSATLVTKVSDQMERYVKIVRTRQAQKIAEFAMQLKIALNANMDSSLIAQVGHLNVQNVVLSLSIAQIVNLRMPS